MRNSANKSRLNRNELLSDTEEKYQLSSNIRDRIDRADPTPLLSREKKTISLLLHYLIRLEKQDYNFKMVHHKNSSIVRIYYEDHKESGFFIYDLNQKKQRAQIESAFPLNDDVSTDFRNKGLGISLYVRFFLEILKSDTAKNISSDITKYQSKGAKNLWKRLRELDIARYTIPGLPFLGSVCNFHFISPARANLMLDIAKETSNTSSERIAHILEEGHSIAS